MATQHNFRIKNGLEVAGTERISSSGVITGALSGSLASATTATTQSASDNSTKIATTAYTDAAISALVDSSPGTLNTLNELAAALGDDASFSTTVTTSIATKLPLAGGTLTGDLGINQAASGYGNLTVGGTGTIIAMRASSGSSRIGWFEAGAGRFYMESLNGADGIKFMHADGSTERMRIDASGNVGFAGQTNPGTPIHVGTSTSTGPRIQISHEDNGGFGALDIDAYGSATFRMLSNFSGSAINGMPDDAFALGTPHAYPVVFTTSGAERMRIQANGRVGIGPRADPQELFHVDAGSGASTVVQFGESFDTYVKIKATNTASAMLNFMNSSDTVKYSLGYRNDSEAGPFRIRAGATLDSGGHKWDFDAAGTFHVIPNNAAALINLTASGSGNDAEVRFGTALNGRGIYLDDSDTNKMKFYTGYGKGVANREIFMNNAGDLAIGATRKFYLDGEGDTYITEYAANEIGFYTGGAQRVRMSGGHLYSNGDIYSGTSSTSASYTLNSQTTHGNWGVGCHNASYAHFTTDRGIYYFNTQCQASGGFHTYSDERLKEEISPLTGALDDVAKMNGVTFKWKDAEKRGGNSTGKQFGVLAQNMLEVDSELPQLNDDPLSPEETRESDDSYYSMDYSRITPFLIEAVKELKTKLEAAEARIATLEG